MFPFHVVLAGIIPDNIPPTCKTVILICNALTSFVFKSSKLSRCSQRNYLVKHNEHFFQDEEKFLT